MKKTFLLIAACVFACASAQAQSSEVEVATQLTKAEQFKERNSLIKEAEIYNYVEGGVRVYVKLFTDLNSGDKLAALEFVSKSMWEAENNQPLGYLDMDHVDDLILVLEKILEESKSSSRGDNYTITYTTPSGIDVCFATHLGGEATKTLIMRKKWFVTDDYGVQTAKYSSAYDKLSVMRLPKFISSIKEAKQIALQALGE